jgi:hypothetical protein
MLTGTPLDLTPFGSVLTGLGILYWLLAVGALLYAARKPKTRRDKALAVAAVLVVFGYMPAKAIWNGYQAKGRLDKAMALFELRCKTAGEKITRRIEDVEGVVWMKWRSDETNRRDQFKLDDPYGGDCGGKDCIASLLRVTSGAEKNPEDASRHKTGYRFVESTDPKSGSRLRYSAAIKVTHVRTADQIEQYKKNSAGVDPGPNVYGFGLDEQPIGAYTARYGITWDDLSTREDREHWIAGSSLKVIDLQSNEVMAERIGYMVDRGQGSEAGGRQPWSFAQQDACPEFPQIGPTDPRRRRSHTGDQMRSFVTKALQPKAGE